MKTISCNCCSDQISMNSSRVEFPVLIHILAVIGSLFVAGGIHELLHVPMLLVFFIGVAVTLILSSIVWAVKK
jgi:hypothetical protein